MQDSLPPELTSGAILRGIEYAWEPFAFPQALKAAPTLGYACLGGQFWFLSGDNSVYEFYWLNTDSTDRLQNETWANFAERSCKEVLNKFEIVAKETDFSREAEKFSSIKSTTGLRLLFNAYFVIEAESQKL